MIRKEEHFVGVFGKSGKDQFLAILWQSIINYNQYYHLSAALRIADKAARHYGISAINGPSTQTLINIT